MELTNEVEVASDIEAVWAAFNDVERIAPCLPGAQLTEIEGDEFRGIVKVKVGPITAQYKGAATFVEQNKDDWRVVIKGDGRDTRGAGNASALITAQLEPTSDTSTKVGVTTDLKVTGKVAQFGRGVMSDVSAKLMQQFADNFEQMMAEGPPAGDAGEVAVAPGAGAGAPAGFSTPAAGGVRKIDMPEPEAVDLLDAAGSSVLKRVAPVVVGVVVVWVLLRILRRRR